MRELLLDVLACPDCHACLECKPDEVSGGDVMRGSLKCQQCGQAFPIVDGIPRFVPAENYARSFGFQWNRFRREQVDSANQTTNSRYRFESETAWTREWMAGQWLLDAGCGSGRFLEIAAESDAQVVGVDLSNAVEAAQENLRRSQNAHLVQASIDRLPFRPGTFNGVYCLGVLQHTPDPLQALRSLASLVKPAGKLAITAYERKPWTLLAGKYLIRPLTRRMPQRVLLAIIQIAMPILFPLTEILFRIPVAKRAFMFVIPVSNWVDNPRLSLRQRYRWAILDTFDALSPRFDRPLTDTETRQVLASAGVTHLRRGQGEGLNLVGEKERLGTHEAKSVAALEI